MFPLVLGPKTVPVITDPEEAVRDIPATVFSALVHAKDPGLLAILDEVAPVVGPDQDWAEMELGLGESPALDHWRELMSAYAPNFPGSGTVMEEAWRKVHADGEAKGEAKGEARAVLRVLAARGVEVSDSARERVMACADLEVLESARPLRDRDERRGVVRRAVGRPDSVRRKGARRLLAGRPSACCLSRGQSFSITKSMHFVRASTSAGSIAGNMATRSWLRPSLR
ncbi:hypothetical protein [Streptomyces sp. MUSC 14]|uniref:hypothetical protein n=1 Tax=Streptomyces sp. MUSC 14 TaxID=1354889 RepID=UPI0015A58161|nr:hypothetical protein [Streptomyces sp. MUSC 14]